MTYRIKRMMLASGQIVTERELADGELVFSGEPPVVGDVIYFEFRDRNITGKVVWGNWQKNVGVEYPFIVSLRVQEIAL